MLGIATPPAEFRGCAACSAPTMHVCALLRPSFSGGRDGALERKVRQLGARHYRAVSLMPPGCRCQGNREPLHAPLAVEGDGSGRGRRYSVRAGGARHPRLWYNCVALKPHCVSGDKKP